MPADARNPQIDASVQADLRDFARRLPGMDLYGVLGIDTGADEDAIREAFFDRSRVYHPDRYFGKEIGAYGDLATEIFKRITTAYEVLRDPELRRSYDRSRPTTRRPEPEAASPEAPEAPEAPVCEPASTASAQTASAPSATPQAGSPRSGRASAPRRPSRMALQRLQRQLGLTRTKARRHFEEALELQRGGDLERAHAILRLALIFDPHEPTYQDVFGEIAMSLGQGRSAAPSTAPSTAPDSTGGEGT